MDAITDLFPTACIYTENDYFPRRTIVLINVTFMLSITVFQFCMYDGERVAAAVAVATL